MSALIDKAKDVLDITSDTFDEEIEDLVAAALLDLGIAGVDADIVSDSDPLIVRAVLTYCKAHFGEPADTTYQRLKASYDEQKAQLQMATGYTDWGECCGG